MQNPEWGLAPRAATYVPTADEEAQLVAMDAAIHRLGLSDEEVAHVVVLRACIAAVHSDFAAVPELRDHELLFYLTHLDRLIGWEALQAAERHLREFVAVARRAG